MPDRGGALRPDRLGSLWRDQFRRSCTAQRGGAPARGAVGRCAAARKRALIPRGAAQSLSALASKPPSGFLCQAANTNRNRGVAGALYRRTGGLPDALYRTRTKGNFMRPLLLWLSGIPLPLVILIWLFFL